jgi:hypothetical protein
LQTFRRRAEVRKDSISEEAIALLEELLQPEDNPVFPRVPDLIEGQEIAAPIELPRPGPRVDVPDVQGGTRLPDPVM